MIRRITATSGTWAALFLRLALGAIFIAHGSQKVFGAFGGPGLNKWMASSPPLPFMQNGAKFWLAAAAFSELIGGILVLLGLFTRVGALLILGVMTTAIFGVHLANGFFAGRPEGTAGGFEYPMALVAICLALLITGGGQLSADMALSRRKR
jgi:putative oxidoreductase